MSEFLGAGFVFGGLGWVGVACWLIDSISILSFLFSFFFSFVDNARPRVMSRSQEEKGPMWLGKLAV